LSNINLLLEVKFHSILYTKKRKKSINKKYKKLSFYIYNIIIGKKQKNAKNPKSNLKGKI